MLQLPRASAGRPGCAAAAAVRRPKAARCRCRELVTVSDTCASSRVYHKDLLPVNYRGGRHGRQERQPAVRHVRHARQARRARRRKCCRSTSSASPTTPIARRALKWDGEWQITYETFRDMGAGLRGGLVLIYLLVVAQFGSYLTPLIIMAPIPLTIIGVMPGHAAAGRAVHRHQHDRHDRAGRHHRAQLHPAGGLHPPAAWPRACRFKRPSCSRPSRAPSPSC
jgi:hypothetical protein